LRVNSCFEDSNAVLRIPSSSKGFWKALPAGHWDDAEATMLGAQDSERAEQITYRPASESEGGVTPDRMAEWEQKEAGSPQVTEPSSAYRLPHILSRSLCLKFERFERYRLE